MDNSMEATTTQRGRQTKTPAKFSQNGSLGAAVGGGGLLPSSQKLLPGITGGAAATNIQSEGGAGRPRVGGSSRGSDIGGFRGSGSDVVSPGAPGSAKTLQALQKSIDRNRTKSYEKWPASLLREACSLRRIMGFSKEKDTDKMARRLTQVDRVMERSSPFFADLDDKAAGD
ncbi:unnamed protein product [Ectocarpus sp. CCAP 1310/34]|nr:unnamed protein product [Ectocarpus sp. CCAP 1310/34]